MIRSPFSIVAACLLASSSQAQELTGAQEVAMTTGASHVLGMTSQCVSMFLRESPIPTGDFEMVSADLGEGRASVTLRREAPFNSGQSELTAEMYFEDDYNSLECSGTVPVFEGSGDHVWGALHRHTRGVGVLRLDTDLGEPPVALTTETCLEDYPAAFDVLSWEIRFVRSDTPDEIRFFVSGYLDAWGDGCLELE
jgi:hypothetical protein